MKKFWLILIVCTLVAACSRVAEPPVGETAPPAAPQNLLVTTAGAQIHLEWQASPAGAVESYRIYRSSGGVPDVRNLNAHASVAGTQTRYTDEGVDPELVYHYAVTAVSPDGLESEPSNAVEARPGDEGQGLSLSTDELVFSSVQGVRTEPRSLVLSNRSAEELTISTLELEGEHASAFAVTAAPLPAVLQAGGTLALDVVFSPAVGQIGPLEAQLTVATDLAAEEAPAPVGLYGLSARGLEGNREPTLQQVVDTLGFAIDIGSDALEFGHDPALLGDEVAAPVFRRAGPGEVALRPVARYSPDEVLPFGYYRLQGQQDQAQGQDPYREVARIAAGEHQTLHPALVEGDASAFDPGDEPFGIYTHSEHFGYITHSEGHLNVHPDQLPHAVRVYPLKDRAGNDVADAYLLAFEDYRNGDFQDYVFVLSNVVPDAQRSAAPQSNALMAVHNPAGMVGGELQPGFFHDWFSFTGIERVPEEGGGDFSDWSELEVRNVATVRLQNTGRGDDLVVSAFNISGLHGSQFTIRAQENEGFSLPMVIPPGEARDVNVVFLGGPNLEGDASQEHPHFCPGPFNRCGEVRRASLEIVSNAAQRARQTVELAAAHQVRPEWIHEVSLTQLAQVFGYSIDLGEPLSEKRATAPSGDEVLSRRWTKADPDKPVYVRQLAAFHGCCLFAGDWFDLGDGTVRFRHYRFHGQTTLPALHNDPSRRAEHLYSGLPATFEIRSGVSDARFYTTDTSGDLGIRTWPIRDRDGRLIEHAYLVAQDYVDAEEEGCGDGAEGSVANCDYNDNVYLITNVRPAP